MAKQNDTPATPTPANIRPVSPDEWQTAQLADKARQRRKELRQRSLSRPRNTRNRIQPKPERQLTVQRAVSGIHPMLRLAGWWLEDAGFPKGTRVRVKVTKRRLVITPEAPPQHAATPAP